MELLVNVIFGLLAFVITRWIVGAVGVPEPVGLLVGILIGIAVFMAGYASRVV